MYRQILVHKEDRDLQRIIWRYNSQDNYTEYQLNTITYGLSCAPFLAKRTPRQLAIDEQEQYPRGAAILLRDVYMDDVLSGAATIEEAKEFQQQLNGLCMAGGLPLRKWSANDDLLLKDIPEEHRMQRELRAWQPHETHSTLGLQWHPTTDDFSFVTRTISKTNFTKWAVLSLTAQLFDPLGWLAPAIVRAKIAFQSTWLQGLDWDAQLDNVSIRQWQNFQEELPLLEEIRVPRWIGLTNLSADAEVHGFADASERAYAAVLYLRTKDKDSWRTILLTAKTKVAPIKQVTLPRLELCAAALLARLAAHVRTTLGFEKFSLHCWTDSTVALGWIQGHPTKWKTYVANRVAEIQTTAPDALWHHIPGKDNPADCASRGLAPSELVNHKLWWRGPPWLMFENSSWPTSSTPTSDVDLPERGVDDGSDDEDQLQESDNTPGDIPTTDELEDTRLLWIRRVQTGNFKNELEVIQQGLSLSKSNALTRLSPFSDSQGILRVGGRLKHTILAFDERHPVILPSDSHFTRLVVEAYHRRTLHDGVQLTLGMIRQRYWIPRGRLLVKRLIRHCVTCVRWRVATPQQLMGDLPQVRVTPARPFFHTGIDYAGPVQLRTKKGRGHRAFKAFVAVFVCLSTRAVHLEVISDYTAEAFLAALKRFVSRLGLCRTIWSDCGTNFVGADAQLRALFAASNPERRQIIGQLAVDHIQWKFNPPSAPHFGGIWEAAVKSLKHHLRRMLGDATLTFEEMSTLLAQIEACLNSRPLQAFSDDPDDLAALTPGHFLVGTALTAVPEPSLLDHSPNRLIRSQLLQRMRDHFWERWSQEYLHSLTHRPKWWKKETGFEVGRLCLIRQENTLPSRWPLVHIVRVHPGKDGQIRVITVRTAALEFTRPIVKLILLPVSDANVEETQV